MLQLGKLVHEGMLIDPDPHPHPPLIIDPDPGDLSSTNMANN